jgi:hypothetical protein
MEPVSGSGIDRVWTAHGLRPVLSRAVGMATLGVQLLALPALAEVPSYIQADPADATKAFGKQVTDKIFSNAYSSMREKAVLHSAKSIAGYDCPADPTVALMLVSPYPIKAGTTAWIERYVVMCQPPTQRNFLMIIDKGEREPRVIEMLPGESAADPLLQRDAMMGAMGALITVEPKGCEKKEITDTAVVGAAPNGRDPWTERWTFDTCGKKAAVDVSFTPVAGGGTNWNAAAVK